jgi:thiol-disulfide isomerase/thioredoxin
MIAGLVLRRVLRRTLSVAVPAMLLIAPATKGQGSDSLPPLLGRTIGTFAWTSMDDSTNIISPLSLRGSFVLVDLWGTWCAPCRREMPFMHEAYQKFHSRGFEILSIAFDISPQKVQVYRREAFPMPWLHVYATAAIEAEATRLFRLDGFPRALLLDRDGTVIRVDTGLRGPALAATLDSLFAGRGTPH